MLGQLDFGVHCALHAYVFAVRKHKIQHNFMTVTKSRDPVEWRQEAYFWATRSVTHQHTHAYTRRLT